MSSDLLELLRVFLWYLGVFVVLGGDKLAAGRLAFRINLGAAEFPMEPDEYWTRSFLTGFALAAYTFFAAFFSLILVSRTSYALFGILMIPYPILAVYLYNWAYALDDLLEGFKLLLLHHSSVAVDVRPLFRLRSPSPVSSSSWRLTALVHERLSAMTQMESARKGVVTDEMRFVAEREDLDAELIRDEVARGRMVIPANKVHLTKRLEPMGIGVASKCKINANIGNSAVVSKVDDELEKLHTAVHLGSDTVMDLSTGGDIDAIRQAIIDASPVPIGTVPIYQIIQNVKDVADITPRMMLDMVEHQAQQGVDYMTIHAGVLLEYLPLTTKRMTGIVSRGGALDGRMDAAAPRAESVVHALRRAIRDIKGLRCDLQPGRRSTAGLSRRRQRRGPVRGVEDAGRTDAEGVEAQRADDDRGAGPHSDAPRQNERGKRARAVP